MDDKKNISFNTLKTLHSARDFREGLRILHYVFEGRSTSQVSGFSVPCLQRWRLVGFLFSS